MLSMHSDEGYVLRALRAGARAYLLKDSAINDLVQAIRAVVEGKSFAVPGGEQGSTPRLHAKAEAQRRGRFL